MNQPGKVLAVIPNYNGGEPVLKCLQSLLEQTYKPLEIVVVDNDSKDGSLQSIRANFPQIKIIESGYNAGWGIACNLGLHSAASEYVVFLNNDAYLDPKCVEEMVKAVSLDPRYGSCASRILLWDSPEKTEVCGIQIYRDGSCNGRGRLGPADRYMKIEEVFCANDCCCLYRRSMLDEIGDYDPDFFIYCDETEMGWRHQLAGWKCVYTPHAVAYPAHSRAAGSYSTFKLYYYERNRLYICFKYFPWPDLLLSFVYAFWRYGMHFWVAAVEKKGALAHYQKGNSFFTGVAALLKAHIDAFRKLPVMWQRRKAIKKMTKINYRDIQQIFSTYGISTREMALYE